MTVLWSRVKYRVDIYKLNVRPWLSGVWCSELSGARRWTRRREGARTWSQWETSYSLIPQGSLECELCCSSDAMLRCGVSLFLTPGQLLLAIGCLVGKGCAQGGLSGGGGSCLRAILPQGQWEPGSQYSQHLGYGCTGRWGWVHSPVRMKNAEWKLNTVSVSSLFVCIMRTNLLTKRCKEGPGYFWLIPHRDLDKSQNLRFLLELVLCCCSKSGHWFFSSVGLEILPMRWWCLHDWDYIWSFFVSPMVPSVVPCVQSVLRV